MDNETIFVKTEKAKYELLSDNTTQSRSNNIEAVRELIEKAKKKVMEAYGRGAKRRKWLSCRVDSYGSPSNRVEFLVLEGSPAKGIVIINWGSGTIVAFDAWMNRIWKRNFNPFVGPPEDVKNEK